MKKIFLFFFLFLLVIQAAKSQPWMRYIKAPGGELTSYEEYLLERNAFEKFRSELKSYAPDEEDEEGENESEELFRRWEWLITPRFSTDGEVPSHILWEEIQNKIKSVTIKEVYGDWRSLGPEAPPTRMGSNQRIGTGRIDCIAFHPSDSNTFWVGAPSGGIWKTTDGGKHWRPMGDDLACIGVADIALYPGRPDTLFIATGDRDSKEVYSVGVLRSYDGGEHWQTTGLSFREDEGIVVNRLLIRPDRPDTMIAATSDGIYFMTGLGLNAVKVASGHFKDIEFMPGNPDIVYAATYGYGKAAIYRSTDGGLTWQTSSTGIDTTKLQRIELAVSPARRDAVYAVAAAKEKSGLEGVYVSFNRGGSWTRVLSGSTKNLLGNSPSGSGDDGQGWYDLALTIDPHNANIIYVGGINIWKSSNGGGSWTLMTWGYPEYLTVNAAYIHVDQHILKFQPGTGHLFAGNDGGLYRSRDGAGTFENLSEGLQTLQIYRIGSSATRREMVLMGSQDNSTILWKDTTWNVVIGGDGMECIIDPEDTLVMYASSQYGNIKRSTNGGTSFASIKPQDADGGWVTPYILDPGNNQVLYAGYKEIYKSTSRGTSWEKLTDNLSSGRHFTFIRISPLNPRVMYAAADKSLWRSEDGGRTWRGITVGLPSTQKITDLTIHTYDPYRIWVSISGFERGNKVFFSSNGGESWENYSDGLPNLPVNCLLFQEGSNSMVYAGTDLGVYVRDRSMDSWLNFSRNLPNVIVNELEIFYPDSVIRAGTYGRGLWESSLFVPDSQALYAEFTSDKIQTCVGGEVTFYDRYPGEKDSVHWYFLPDGTPEEMTGHDTVVVTFDNSGSKDVALVVYRNGLSDSIYRQKYITVTDTMALIVNRNYKDYYWHGNELVLEASGADHYLWVNSHGDTVHNPTMSAYPDNDIAYTLYADQGICHDTVRIKVRVYPNDNLRYASELELGENGPFINYETTVEPGEPAPPPGACNTDSTWCDEFGTGEDYLAHSVWFRFTAPSTGTVSIDTKGFDNQIAVYDSPSPDSLLAGHYHLLAANDDYHDAAEHYAAALEEVTGLEPGKTYWLQVDGSGGNLEGTFYIYFYNGPLSVPSPLTNGENGLFRVYPNPTDGNYSLSFNRDHPGGILKIYSLNGKLVQQTTVPPQQAGNIFTPALALPEAGLYILMLTGDGHVHTCRVMVR